MLLVGQADLSQIVVSITYQDVLNGGASSLRFEYPLQLGGMYPNGEAVILIQQKTQVFYGFLFSSSTDGKTVTCTAYDQLRYLQERVSFKREIESLGSFANRVFSHAGGRLRLGELLAGGANLKAHLFQQQSYWEMLVRSIEEAEKLDGCRYTLRDEFGAICLRDVLDLRMGLVVGDGSLAIGYRFEQSIDSDTYNAVRIYQDNAEKGVRVIASEEDAVNMSQWGRLILWQPISGQVNEVQGSQEAKALLKQKNRETKKLSLRCVGNLQVRAGCGVRLCISDIGVNDWATVLQAEHQFQGESHSMQLEVDYQVGR